MKKTVILLIISLIITTFGYSQVRFLGINAGGYYFHNYPKNPFPAGGIFYKDNFYRTLSLSLHAKTSIVKNFDTKLLFWELKAMVEYNFIKFFYVRYNKKYTPFIAGGLAMTHLPIENVGYDVIIPLNAGFKYKLNRYVIIGIEGGFNLSNIHNLYHYTSETNLNWYSNFGLTLEFLVHKPFKACPTYF